MRGIDARWHGLKSTLTMPHKKEPTPAMADSATIQLLMVRNIVSSIPISNPALVDSHLLELRDDGLFAHESCMAKDFAALFVKENLSGNHTDAKSASLVWSVPYIDENNGSAASEVFFKFLQNGRHHLARHAGFRTKVHHRHHA